MRITTYTKRDIATRLGNKLDISTRKSLVYTDEVFNVIRELLCEEKPYVRIEVRNFGVLESKPTKAKPKARNPKTNEEMTFSSILPEELNNLLKTLRNTNE